MKYLNECNYIIKILKSVINGSALADSNEELDWDDLYMIAEKQNILAPMYYGVCKLRNCDSIPHFKDYEKAYKLSLVEDSNREREVDALKPKFNHVGLDFMPLKGSVTKHLYPDKSMRYMSDIDIFYRGADSSVIDYIMQSSGYTIEHTNDRETAYVSSTTNIKIEMQTALIDKEHTLWNEYLKDVWDYATYVNEGEYKMTPEMLYIYHIIHMAKHFLNGGIGILHIADIYMMLRYAANPNLSDPLFGMNGLQDVFPDIDVKLIQDGLNQCGLAQFEKCLRRIAVHWFGTRSFASYVIGQDQWPDETEKRRMYKLMKGFVFANGAYGTTSQHLINEAVKEGDDTASFKKKMFWGKTGATSRNEDLEKPSKKNPFKWAKFGYDNAVRKQKESKKAFKAMKNVTDKRIEKTMELMEICGLR